MKLFLLLDLDGTLLGNNADQFVRAYFNAFGEYFSSKFPKEKVLKELKAGSAKMIANANPEKTLEMVFDESFYPALSVTKEQLEPEINRFYSEVFPELKRYTHTLPEAKRLVDLALRRGYEIVLATNPLFPQTAIEQRLEWAGLPVNQVPFRMITTYENFHFCKPNPAYYAEILCNLAWPAAQVIMAGNDPDMDILPAQTMGMLTYLVTELGNQTDTPISNKTGSLKEFPEWLEMTENGQMLSVAKAPKALSAALLANLAVLPNKRTDALSEIAEIFVKNELDLISVLSQLVSKPEPIPIPAEFSLEYFYKLRAISIRQLNSLSDEILQTTPVPGGDGSTTLLDYLHAFVLSECSLIRKSLERDHKGNGSLG
jgi:FMN phosphatase YigB (HAD superfamily)